MDNLAVMAPSTPVVSNELSDESESESISLDLHVSDTDEISEVAKNVLLESEDDILNKFADEEKHMKSIKTKVNGVIGPPREEKIKEKVVVTENTMEGNAKMEECEENIEEDEENMTAGKLKVEESRANVEEIQLQDKSEETLINGKSPTPVNEELKNNGDKIQNENKEQKADENTDDKINKDEDKIEQNKEHEIEDKMKEIGENKIEENKEKRCDSDDKNESDKGETKTDEEMATKVEEKQTKTVEEKQTKTVEEKAKKNEEEKTQKNEQEETKKGEEDGTKKDEEEETKKDEDQEEEEEDLLQVMETTFDEDNKDENSCSSLSEKENEEIKEEIEDHQEEMDLPAESDETNLEEQDNEESMQVDEENNEENEDSGQESEEINQEIETMLDGVAAAKDDNDVTEESTQIVQEDNEEEISKENGETEIDERKSPELQNKYSGEELTKDVSTDDDMNDCPMDIEENDIGGVIITEKLPIAEKAMEVDVDANKENENVAETQALSTEDKTQKNKSAIVSGADVVTLIEDDVTDDAELKDKPKKTTKRKQPDQIHEDSHKKLKLDPRNEVKEKRQIEALKSFKEFMREKKLKVLTRLELEEFCLQKMCEWIIDKSELAELRQKVKVLEQTLDNWRKEAVTVAKQTRDLKIVHDRVIADLKLMKEQTGKPLVPVKITRSVGLQAVMENNIRRPSLPNGVAPNVRVATSNTNAAVSNVRNTVNNVKTPIRHVAAVTNTQNKSSPQRIQAATIVKPLQPIPTKDNSRASSVLAGTTVAKASSQQTASTGTTMSRKSTEAPKAVIDLTDDEDKTTTPSVVPSVTLTPSNRGRVNGQSPIKATTIATTNGPTKHVMLMPTSMLTTRPVMLKVNSNLVSSANTITIPTSQVSIVTTQSKNGQVRLPVTSITSVRQTSLQKFKHPAPLPLPPPSQHHIVGRKPLPPKPILNLTRSACGTGIVLQWKMPYQLEQYEAIISYQLYAYQETKTPPRTDNWGKIGDVKALELPMAVTLTQFAVGNRYFFAVRAVDSHKRLGPFSDPQTILL